MLCSTGASVEETGEGVEKKYDEVQVKTAMLLESQAKVAFPIVDC